jgi:hypothetical protein
MAIKRTDTPLAATSEPKAIDPVRTQMTDPDTGVTTYKHTWSNSYGKKSGTPTTKTTTPLVKRTSTDTAKKPISAPVRKPSSAPARKEESGSTSGSREFTSVPRLTPAGKTDDAKPSAAIPTEKQLNKVAPPTREEKIKIGYQKSYNEQKKPGETFEQWHKGLEDRVNKQSIKNQRRGDGDGGLIDTGKNKSTACKSC